MTQITVQAPVKLNLYLHIVGRKGDGYHEVDTLIAFTDYGDTVTVEAAIFHGANWLYRVRGAMGELFVTQPNTGAPGFSRGQEARLIWPEGNLSIFAEAS